MKNPNSTLITIEGIDSVGKQTQKELLRKYFLNRNYKEGKDFSVVDFPRYNHFSSYFVERYLNGDIDKDPNKVNAWLTSSFYAIDRAISYKTEDWGEVYRNGGIIIADRYILSNVIYQGTKLMEAFSGASNIVLSSVLKDFTSWVYNIECDKYGIPDPDITIVLTLDTKVNQRLLDARAKKEGKDIHEANNEYLNNCRKTIELFKNSLVYNSARGRYEFLDVTDNENNTILPKKEIHKQIVSIVENFMK